MIIRFHIPFEEGVYWSDDAISDIVGTRTKVAGCPAIVVAAFRCRGNDDAMDITTKLPSIYESYILMKRLFQPNELEGISFKLPEVKHGEEKKRRT